MSDGTTYEIDYEFKPKGKIAQGAPDPAKAVERTVTGASSDAICESIAYYLIQSFGNPVREGRAVIREVPPGWSALDVLRADALPTDAKYEIRDLRGGTPPIEVDLATRRPVGDVLGDIEQRLGDVSDRV